MRKSLFKKGSAYLFIVAVLVYSFLNPFDPRSSFEAQPPIRFSDDDFTEKVNRFFEAGVTHLGFSGYVLIAQEKTIFSKGYGRLSPENPQLPTATTPFRVGSVTKPLTALAALIAESEGKLNIDSAICNFRACPCGQPGSSITSKELMLHKSGLPHDFSSFLDFLKHAYLRPFAPREAVYRFWEDKVCAVAPDEKKKGSSNYSNLGYFTLGKVIESVEKKTLSEFVRSKIFSVFNMTKSLIESEDNLNNKIVGMKSRQNPFNKNLTYEINSERFYGAFGGAGAAISTAEDMLKFLEAIESRRLYPNLNWEFFLGPKKSYQGIWVTDVIAGGKTLRWHNGSVAGFYSLVAAIPEIKLKIIVLSNIHRRSSSDVKKFFEQLNSLFGEEGYALPAP